MLRNNLNNKCLGLLHKSKALNISERVSEPLITGSSYKLWVLLVFRLSVLVKMSLSFSCVCLALPQLAVAICGASKSVLKKTLFRN